MAAASTRNSNVQRTRGDKNRIKKYCKIDGKCFHDSKSCRALKKQEAASNVKVEIWKKRNIS